MGKWTILEKNIVSVEKVFLNNTLGNKLNEPILQLGTFSLDYCQNNKIIASDESGNCHVLSNYHQLPFSRYCLFKTIIIPHVLEFNENYVEILEETYNILQPELGKLVIFSFNPNSLWGLRNKIFNFYSGKWIKKSSLEFALKEIGFTVVNSNNFYLRPPIDNNLLQNIMLPFERLNPLLPFGAINMIIAMKRVVTLTPTPLKWSHEKSGVRNECS